VDLRVPRLVHHVWLGADPLPPELERARRSWRAARGWTRKVWTDANLPDDLLRPQAGEFLRSPGERLQFLRLELLHQFGGVVLDPDLVCRGSLEPLLDGLELAAASFADGRADESLLAAVPRHPIVERLLRELPAAAYWGAEEASVGERLTHEATKGAEHIMLLPPTAVTGPGDETVDTVAVRLYEREQAEDDPRGTALAAEADLAAAQAELEDANRRTHDLRARQKRVDLELASFRRRSGGEAPRPADPP
jgi:hypothetical protein